MCYDLVQSSVRRFEIGGMGKGTPSTRTVPSAHGAGVPRGYPARIRPHDDASTRRSLQRENESATILAKAGYAVEQRPPPLPNGKRPDYIIEGEYFDNYAPSTSSARNIASSIEREKVAVGQAERIILNLDDSNASLADLSQQLAKYPIFGLKEVIVIKNGQVLSLFP